MDVRLLFPNEYLSSADLAGRDVTLTISAVTVDKLRTTDGGMTEKGLVHFTEMQKRPKAEQKKLVLNKTNATTIAKMYGNEMDEWPGRRITLYPTTCTAFGDTVECIRIREKAPK